VTIRELEILKAALEGDIIRQKDAENRDHPAWKHWFEDSEKLLKKVNKRLWDEKCKQLMINNLKGGRW
jgi:hypothetical protein